MKTKECKKCGVSKELSDFYKRAKSKDGLRYYCKECEISDVTKSGRTISGLVRKIYLNQIKTSERRGHNPPTYTREQLYEWVTSQEVFKHLYESWVSSGYIMDKTPSVDRKDDYLGYSIDNISLMTSGENNRKSHRDAVEGRNNKRSVAVLQCDLDGNTLREYYSMNHASRETGISQGNIGMVCSGKSFKGKVKKDGTVSYHTKTTAGGFIWKYKESK